MREYLRFLMGMAKVGCIGFGGGTALVPVLEEEFVLRQKLETKKEFDEDVIIAGITPGALPVEVAASIGKHAFGVKGLLGGPVMISFPGIVLALALFTVFSVVNDAILGFVNVVSVAATAFIIFLLAHYIVKVFEDCKKGGRERLIKAAVVVIAVCTMVCGDNVGKLTGMDVTLLFRASTIHVLMIAFFFVFFTGGVYTAPKIVISFLVSLLFLLSHGKSPLIEEPYAVLCIEAVMIFLAALGLIKAIRSEQKMPGVKRREMAKELLIWFAFLLVFCLPSFLWINESVMFAGRGMFSSFMSFGGGDAYLTIADGLFVESGMISEEVYYGQIAVVVNVLPGSILCKTLAGIGYYFGFEKTGMVIGGLCLAATGLGAGIAASCGLYRAVGYVYRSIHSFSMVRIFERWFRPIFAGLLINLILSLTVLSGKNAVSLDMSKSFLMGATLLLAAVDFCLNRWGKVKPMWILALNLGVVFAAEFLKVFLV